MELLLVILIAINIIQFYVFYVVNKFTYKENLKRIKALKTEKNSKERR